MGCKSVVIRSKQLLSPAPHHERCWHHCCQQMAVPLSPSFLVSSPSVPHSDFHILCVGSQYIKVGRLHSEFCSHIFSGDWTLGDIVKLEVFKWLRWGFGKGCCISCLDLKWPTMTMHWNMKTITSKILIWKIFCIQDSLEKVSINRENMLRNNCIEVDVGFKARTGISWWHSGQVLRAGLQNNPAICRTPSSHVLSKRIDFGNSSSVQCIPSAQWMQRLSVKL